MPQAKATVNKSQKVREMLNQLGLHASPTEISRRLAQQGIKVRPHMVSTLKNKMKKGRTGWELPISPTHQCIRSRASKRFMLCGNWDTKSA